MFSGKLYFGDNIIILLCWSVNSLDENYFFTNCFFLQTVKGKAGTLATTKYLYIPYVWYHDVYRSNTYIYIYTYIHTYTYIYTYTHTHISMVTNQNRLTPIFRIFFYLINSKVIPFYTMC